MQEKNVAIVTFAKRLQKLMDERGLGPTRLAKEIGISHVAILAYIDEEEERIPQVDILFKLARFFGVTAEYLRFGEQAMAGSPSPVQASLPSEIQPAVNRLVDIHADDRDTWKTIDGVIALAHRGISRQLVKPAGHTKPLIQGINSEKVIAVGLVSRDAASKAVGLDPKSLPSPEAAEPTAHKAATGRGTVPHSSKRPVPPKRAPGGPGK